MEDPVSAPPLRLLLGESRAALSYGRYLLRGLGHNKLPRGQGEPVLVLPGFAASDVTTRPLRRSLSKLNYRVYGWAQGTNLGLKQRGRELLVAHLQAIAEWHGQPVNLVGWSLGGVFARELARAHPQQVQQVFSLGSPISGHPNANNVTTVFSLFNPKARQEPDMEAFRKRAVAPPVPCTAIYTRQDGIVAWPCSREAQADNTENVEVTGTHVGLPWNPQVLAVIADRLAQPRKS